MARWDWEGPTSNWQAWEPASRRSDIGETGSLCKSLSFDDRLLKGMG